MKGLKVSLMTQKRAPSTSSHRNAKLIYVVDDEPLLLELASVILEPAGYTLRCFRDPMSALRAFAESEEKPELVITDYAMHDMSGSDLIGGVRQVSPDQKVLMVSGTIEEHGLPVDERKPDDFLPKPYRAADLVAAVKKLAE